MMIGKNLRFYRLKKGMTMKELAEKTGITNMAISNYEKDKRNPDIVILRKMADVLGVKVLDFMSVRNENLIFQHGEFRKNLKLSNEKKDLVYETIEDYVHRLFTVVDILGDTVLPIPPLTHRLKLVNDVEQCADKLRKWLKLSPEGPVGNLTGLLEDNGIIVCQIDIDSCDFSGINGMINQYPYITVNAKNTPERQRFTMAHELAHMAFDWSGREAKECERIADGVAGAFLFPANDARHELGLKRKGIYADMLLAAEKFGISMLCLAFRAKELKIVSEQAYRDFMIVASKNGWRKNEPSRIKQEYPGWFRELVYRAITEKEISMQKGAELLREPYDIVSKDLLQLYGGMPPYADQQ